MINETITMQTKRFHRDEKILMLSSSFTILNVSSKIRNVLLKF